jgi:hypothetical protein
MAHRGGNKEKHSYIAGSYNDLAVAKTEAENTEYHRGGKYSCVIQEVIDGSIQSECVYETESFKIDSIVLKKGRIDKASHMAFYEDEQDYIKLLQAALNEVPFLTSIENEATAKDKRREIQDAIGDYLNQFMKTSKLNKKTAWLTI